MGVQGEDMATTDQEVMHRMGDVAARGGCPMCSSRRVGSGPWCGWATSVWAPFGGQDYNGIPWGRSWGRQPPLDLVGGQLTASNGMVI